MTLSLYPKLNRHGLAIIPSYARALPNGMSVVNQEIPDDETAILKWRIVDKSGETGPGWASVYNSPAEACAAYEQACKLYPAGMFDKPEVSRMLTLSTAHLTPETIWKLTNNPETDELCMTVYPKSEFGWFVYFSGIPQSSIDALPKDLRACVYTAQNLNCDVLCFDCDAEPLGYLDVYSEDE